MFIKQAVVTPGLLNRMCVIYKKGPWLLFQTTGVPEFLICPLLIVVTCPLLENARPGAGADAVSGVCHSLTICVSDETGRC